MLRDPASCPALTARASFHNRELHPDASLIFVFYPAALPAQMSKIGQYGQAGQLDKRQRLKKHLGEV